MQIMKLDNFSNYEIYPEEGKVFSYKRNRYIGSKHKDGYWQVGLMSDDGKQHNFWLHRLIWQAVNGAIPEGMEINHLDENPSNNVISNLSLCTHKENINFGTRNERAAEKMTNRSDQSKQVAAFKNGVLVMVFPSANETRRQGYNNGAVSQCCNGKRQSHKGYQWRYLS